MSNTLVRLAAAAFLAVAAPGFLPDPVRAQETTSPAPSAPSAPSAQAPSPQAAPAAPDAKPESGPHGEGSTGEPINVPARPFAYIEGKAGRDEIYGAILGSLGLVKRAMDNTELKPSGRPLAVFVDADDTSFKYRAGYPLDEAPAGKTALSDDVKIGQTPGGKAMRFQHLGAYADIDATYDAVTAYLDDKGIDAQDTFVEEYLNDVKDADDPTLQVNIYVFLK